MAKYLIIEDENFIINLDLIESIKHNPNFGKTYFNQQFARDGEEPYYEVDDPEGATFIKVIEMLTLDKPWGVVHGLPKAGEADE